MGKTKKTVTSRYDVAEFLQTPEDMAEYLEACIEEAPDDAAFIAKALGNVARAKGMTWVAREAGLSRESLYKALSGDRSPDFDTILRVLRALELTLRTQSSRRAASPSVVRELPSSWHRTQRWRGQLDRVRRWHRRLCNASNPIDAEDYLYAFFQNCYHLKNWLKPPEHDSKAVRKLLDSNIEMRICRDLSNMTKHYELNRKPATEREPSVLREYAGKGEGWFEHDSNLVILSGGKSYDAREVASRCLNVWETFLNDEEGQRSS